MKKMNKDQAFFYEHAGWSYNPKTQTKRQGRIECAAKLAKAEMDGRAAGLSFRWRLDDETTASFTDTIKPPYFLWMCSCSDRTGKSKASLCGIDLGRKHDLDQPYCRVVEAELAMEALA